MNTTIEKRKPGKQKRFGERQLRVRMTDADITKLESWATLEGITLSDVARRELREAIARKTQQAA